MGSYVLSFQHVDRASLTLVGGKGANLGELSRVAGIHVPEGFCVSTEAYQRVVGEHPAVGELIDRLALLRAEDRSRIGELGGEIRRAIEGMALPAEIAEDVTHLLSRLGETGAYAVRSSATAEDLPLASFAGQQDTYLNVMGKQAILQHISKCWASLFTERAITYRLQHGLDHRKVHMAVVVQKMVFPQASGVLFTADPVTSNRKVSSIDAGFGLGEALVSGLVDADLYKVRDGKVVDKKVATKKLAIHASSGGGTIAREIEPARQKCPVLTDEQILRLEQIGRRIEAHFGSPQDIEWCLVDDALHVVQSRPITTLYPIPEANDQENHVYVSVGHQQMMTDPMKALGLSFFQLTAPRPMFTAGGRLFVDVAPDLASPVGRDIIVNGLGKSDPLIKDALMTILERGDFIRSLPEDAQDPRSGKGKSGGLHPNYQALNDYDPAVVADLIDRSRAAIDQLKHDIQAVSGPDLFDFIRDDLQKRRQGVSDSQSLGVIITAMNAASWLNEKMMEWLGERNAADVLAQSVPNNITSQMGLELLEVADVIRPHPALIDCLQRAGDEGFMDELAEFEGGSEALDAIRAYLNRYGVRCAGEIDITRTRWVERPTTLIPMILGNIRNFEPDASHRRFEQGRQEASNKERELLERLKKLPDGEQKAVETKRMINLVRNLSGYREYPKYSLVSRYYVYKQALLREAEQLLQAGVIREKEDIYHLTFEELREVVRTNQLDHRIVSQRKDEYRLFEKLTPPRVITSEGEVVAGKYQREDLPAGALMGLPVSSGVIEGRARVILDMEDAALEDGDILVTPFTDPSWTPLFVSIKGLVTEVGGLMTHGAVIAREYGLPAVIGVENATKLIADGQRIRVHGTEGYVEIL
jgi:pyruvate,water dikinase